MNLKETVIGIELGSTRIKAVMLNKENQTIAKGSFSWDNHLENGIWTYHYDEILTGLRECFSSLKDDFYNNFNQKLTSTGAIGISAMMHGYIPSDESFNPLCSFRTWRNTTTSQASEELTRCFGFNIPQRWCIAHLYQAYLNKEDHIAKVSHVETLSSYVHRLLTGENVIGMDDASGMFPIDSGTLDFNQAMVDDFKSLTGFDIKKIFPKVLLSGQNGGFLTEEGARLLDPEGFLEAGIAFAPPEGDAGTGMVATNSVRLNTGNVSAGTSDFAMVVTDAKLGVHREIDMVTTPSGKAVAMVHCNNCTTDINTWINLFGQFASRAGIEMDKDDLFSLLYSIALEGKVDCNSLVSCNYYSGEGVTDFNKGIPVFLHSPETDINLADFMRNHMMSAMATLKIGMDILKKENVKIDKIFGHGGYFKTPKAGQRILSAAIDAPISVMDTAGEGGPYGMALLCSYLIWGDGATLEDYLDSKVFNCCAVNTVMASDDEVKGFDKYIDNYRKLLDVERKALEVFNA